MAQTPLEDYLTDQARQELNDYQGRNLVKQVNQNKKSAYFKFQEYYRSRWVDFAHDCIKWDEGEGLTFYQDDILGNFDDYDRQAVRGPRGLGKTTMGSILLLGWALTNDGGDWKVATTASAWLQLEEYFWPEVHKWSAKLDWEKIGREAFNPIRELMKMKLVGQHNSRAFAVSPEESQRIEGLHANQLLIEFDEAKIIPEATWDSLEGATTNAESANEVNKIFAISTPGEPAGRFYDIHSKKPGYDDWHTVHITMEDAVSAGRMSQSWVDQRLLHWGSESALFKNQVLGEFAAHHENVIIPLAHVEAAMKRHDEWVAQVKAGASKGTVTSLALDISQGTTKGDKSIFTLVYNEVIAEIIEFYAIDPDVATMEIAGKAKGLIERYSVPMYIDIIGIGVGVYNRLREQNIKLAMPFVASHSPPPRLKDSSGEMEYKNMRAAMWFTGRDMLNPDNGFDVAIPRDSELTGELTRTRQKPILSKGVLQVESKQDIRNRIKRSTDKADSVLQGLTGGVLIRAATTRVYVPGQGYI